jgi:hypothetical protein
MDGARRESQTFQLLPLKQLKIMIEQPTINGLNKKEIRHHQ